MQGNPRSISPLLGIGKNQQWWLCHQTPCTYSSSGNTTNFPKPHQNSTRTTWTSHKLAVRFFFGRTILNRAWFHSIRVRTYVRTYIPLHSTSQSGVEQILSSTTKIVPTPLVYVPTYKRTLHSTCIRTYVQMYFHSIPHHKVEWNEKRVWIHTKSQMLKKSPDTEKARRWKYPQTLKKPDAEKIARRWKSIKSTPHSKSVLDIS